MQNLNYVESYAQSTLCPLRGEGVRYIAGMQSLKCFCLDLHLRLRLTHLSFRNSSTLNKVLQNPNLPEAFVQLT